VVDQQTWRRVLVSAPGTFELDTVAVSSPAPGDTVVEMLAAGICGSDTHAAQGRHPFIRLPYAPGHEAVGRVLALGGADPLSESASTSLQVGQRVVVEPLTVCGTCQYCTDGRYNLCSHLVFFGCGAPMGAMAERFVVPQRQLHPVPDDLDDLMAVLAEPLATPVHAVDLVGGDLTRRTVVVIGAGAIGLLTAAVARHNGAARVSILDRSADRRERALRLGADAVHDTGSADVAAAVRDDLGGSADVVFECIARQESMDQAVAIAHRGGTVVVVGVPSEPLRVPMPEVQDGQVRIQGSATYTGSDIEQAIRLLSQGLVRAEDFVTATYPLDRAQQAFAAASSGAEVKVVLRPDG